MSLALGLCMWKGKLNNSVWMSRFGRNNMQLRRAKIVKQNFAVTMSALCKLFANSWTIVQTSSLCFSMVNTTSLQLIPDLWHAYYASRPVCNPLRERKWSIKCPNQHLFCARFDLFNSGRVIPCAFGEEESGKCASSVRFVWTLDLKHFVFGLVALRCMEVCAQKIMSHFGKKPGGLRNIILIIL